RHRGVRARALQRGAAKSQQFLRLLLHRDDSKFISKGDPMGKMIELTASDGHKLAAYRADPAGKPRGAVVVIQEIFGVNSHVKSVADGYAKDGYVAIAPAMFDRLQKGYDTGYSQPEIQAGIAMMQKLDWKNTMADV